MLSGKQNPLKKCALKKFQRKSEKDEVNLIWFLQLTAKRSVTINDSAKVRNKPTVATAFFFFLPFSAISQFCKKKKLLNQQLSIFSAAAAAAVIIVKP